MKISLLTVKSNLNYLFNHAESSSRCANESWLIKPDTKILRLHSYLTTQYLVQFAIQRFIKPNSQIHQDHYVKVRKTLCELSIEKINLIDHEAKYLAATASKLLIRQKHEGTNSIIWMIDQLALISNLPASETRKLFPEISNWLDGAVSKCESTIKKTKFEIGTFQEDLFTSDAKGAGIDDTSSRKRNVIKK